MGKRGRRPTNGAALYEAASELYFNFQRLAGYTEEWSFDGTSYERLKKKKFELSDAEKTKFERREEMIRAARLTPAERHERLLKLERDMEWSKFDKTLNFAYERSRKKSPRFAKPHFIRDLFVATTPERVREIVEATLPSTFHVLKPTVDGFNKGRWMVLRSDFSQTLHYFAETFIAAKNHPRFPRGRVRRSTMQEQFWFISRAIAGAVHGIGIRSAIELVGAGRPEEVQVPTRPQDIEP